MPVSNNIRQLNMIADYYQLLSFLLQLPSKETLRGLAQGGIVEDIQSRVDEMRFSDDRRLVVDRAVIELSRQSQSSHADLARLRHAYTSLFTNPEKPLVAIYESLFLFWEKHPESVWDDAPRLFINPAALDAERCYKKAGLFRSAELNESGDYMVTELEFMARLFRYKAESDFVENEEESVAAADLIDEFNHFHFEKWGVAFFEKVALVTPNPIYQAIGNFGAVFIAQMLEYRWD